MKLDHLDHYAYSNTQPYEVIKAYRLGFELGNIVKYICRRNHKGSYISNQRKWRVYAGLAVSRPMDELIVAAPEPNTGGPSPWKIEVDWQLQRGSEELDLLWAVIHISRGADARGLQNYYNNFVGSHAEKISSP